MAKMSFTNPNPQHGRVTPIKMTPPTPPTPPSMTTTVGSGITTTGGFPNMPAYESPFDPVTGKFKYAVPKQSFDVVSPWQKLANEGVQSGYQKALATNQAMQGTNARQATEGLAMSGGVSARQTARLADRSSQNKLMNDQLAEQQRQANQLQVNTTGEEMGRAQEGYLGQSGLQTDIANQGNAINGVGGANNYMQQLVEDLIKKQMGINMGGAL